MPPQVDTRQMSLFGAAWTAASIKYLSKGGAKTLTYYEASGWKGVMEKEEGSPLPYKFPSIPGGVFPLYHVFRWLAGRVGTRLIGLESSNSLVVDGIALENNGETILILGNFTGKTVFCLISGFTGRIISRIDITEKNYEEASRSPEDFYKDAEQRYNAKWNGTIDFQLSPHSVTRLKIQKSKPT